MDKMPTSNLLIDMQKVNEPKMRSSILCVAFECPQILSVPVSDSNADSDFFLKQNYV